MPNHVTNILDAKDIAVLPIYSEDEDGHKDVDFNLLIPMPEVLLDRPDIPAIHCNEKDILSCYLTENQDVEIIKTLREYGEKNFLTNSFCNARILTEEEKNEILGRLTQYTYEELVNAGKALYECIKEYGYHDWYYWRCANWGCKWNAYDTEIYDDDQISFLTAWSPPEPYIKKLSETYPDKRFHLMYCDEFIGNFAGEQVYLNGEVIEERYAEGLDHPDMGYLLHKMYDYNIKYCVYVDKDGNIVQKDCQDCKFHDECDRLSPCTD